jgi:two-component sensor histidine kinase
LPTTQRTKLDGRGPPTKEGFGTTLIKRTFEYELGGSAELRFAEKGLRCQASFPLQ